MYRLSEEEKIPKWSVTWTWPASMAARSGDGCCLDALGIFSSRLDAFLSGRGRRLGGETGASRLATMGIFLLSSWHSFFAGGLLLPSKSRVRFMMPS